MTRPRGRPPGSYRPTNVRQRLATIHKITEIEVGLNSHAWPAPNQPCMQTPNRTEIFDRKVQPTIKIWFELILGKPFPEGHRAMKLCDTPRCRSPHHHELVDLAQDL